jgi:hypothetical protein
MKVHKPPRHEVAPVSPPTFFCFRRWDIASTLYSRCANPQTVNTNGLRQPAKQSNQARVGSDDIIDGGI